MVRLSPRTDLGSGLVGGIVIGASSTLLILFNKKISGMSGIVKTFIKDSPSTYATSYISGLLASGVVLNQFVPGSFGETGGPALTSVGYALSGLLVGFGASLSNGCTSGHGVCGLPRLSSRSLVAVGTFMSTGFLTAGLVRGSTVLYAAASKGATSSSPLPAIAALGATTLLLSFGPRVTAVALDRVKQAKLLSIATKLGESSVAECVSAFACAFIFGLGLGVSGMTNPQKVVGFLDALHPTHGWDPSLAAVMGGAVAFNLMSFPFLQGASREHAKALNRSPAFSAQDLTDWRLVTGAALFGIGWGLGGVCPGPALVSFGAGRPLALGIVPWMVVGIAAAELGFGSSFSFLQK
jgi:uncharacterized membrane protein YedE/YeeE